MRVCPKCHYKDPIQWRHKRFRLFTCYCHISELEQLNSALADLIKKQTDYTDKNGYIYHLTSAGYVDRIHSSDTADGKHWHEPSYEAPKKCRYQPLNQQRLGVFSGGFPQKKFKEAQTP